MKILAFILATLSWEAQAAPTMNLNQTILMNSRDGLTLTILGEAAEGMYYSQRAVPVEMPRVQDAKSIDGFVCVETSKSENHIRYGGPMSFWEKLLAWASQSEETRIWATVRSTQYICTSLKPF